MNILFLDTCTEYAILGICDQNGVLVSSLAQKHERELSIRVYPMLDEVLKLANISRDKIDAFSVGLGPGSFTGVRVAVTTMRTFAQVFGKPLVAFNTLDAFAKSAYLDQQASESPILVVCSSRRNEAYVGAYLSGSTTASPSVMSYESVKEIRAELGQSCIIVGPEQLLETIFPDRSKLHTLSIEHPNPRAIALLSQAQINAKAWCDPLSLDPMYIALPAVSQHKQK